MFPLKPLGKAPATPNGFHDATTDPGALASWAQSFGRDACPNLGIVPPPGFVVVDVDPRNGGTTERLPDTRVARTGGGGIHAVYQVPAGLNLPSKLRAGVDVKQAGRGYIVAQPSVVLQPDGRFGWYQWADASERVEPAPAELVTAGWFGDAGVSRRVEDLDEPAFDEAEHERIAAAIAPTMGDGGHHDLCKNLGGWLRQRGATTGDAAAIVKLLPVKSERGGINAAIAAWGIQKSYGYAELAAAIGDQAMAELERTPNPELERTAALVAPLVEHAERVARESRATQTPQQAAKQVDPSDPWFGFGPPDDLAGAAEPLEPLIIGLDVAKKYCTGIVAEANGGKTPLLAQALLCVANGLPFLGHTTVQTRCALFVFEKFRGVKSRVRSVAKKLGVSPASIDVFSIRSESLNDPGVVDRLHALIRARGYGLCGVDTYNSATGDGVDRNSAEFAEALRRLTSINGDVAWLFNLHTRKSGDPTSLKSIDGHNSIAGALDACWSLVRTDLRDKDKYELVSVRELHEPFKPIRLCVANTESSHPLDALEPARCYEVDSTPVDHDSSALPGERARKPTKAERVDAVRMAIGGVLSRWHTLPPVQQRDGLTLGEWQRELDGFKSHKPGVRDLVKQGLRDLVSDGRLVHSRGGGANRQAERWRPLNDDERELERLSEMWAGGAQPASAAPSTVAPPPGVWTSSVGTEGVGGLQTVNGATCGVLPPIPRPVPAPLESPDHGGQA